MCDSDSKDDFQIERRKSSRRKEDCPLTSEQAYTLTTEVSSILKRVDKLEAVQQNDHEILLLNKKSILTICNRVKETESIVKNDHELLLKRTAAIEKIDGIEQNVQTILTYHERRKGAMAVLLSLSAVAGALITWFLRKYFGD